MAKEKEDISKSSGLCPQQADPPANKAYILIDLTNTSEDLISESDNDVICLDPDIIPLVPDVITLPGVINSRSRLSKDKSHEENECSSLTKKRFLSTSCQTEKIMSCAVCLDDLLEVQNLEEKQTVSTNCGHIFCLNCILTAIRDSHKCPVCRKRLTMKSYHPIYI